MLQPYDLPLEELKIYKPDLTKREDFINFWTLTKEELAEHPVNCTMDKVDYPSDRVDVYEVVYRGFRGAEIRGYYARPKKMGIYPGLVWYHGYNYSFDGGIHETVNWALHGYAVFGMLARGQQGSEDNMVSSHGHSSGWLTKGVLDKETYYYRGVYMDAVRAVEVLSRFEEVDHKRIGVIGGSQGGGIALAAAALSPIPAVVVSIHPFLSHFQRSIDVATQGPYLEINDFFRRNTRPELEEQTMETLSYFDVMNLAPMVTCTTLMSIGLIDDITPPSTVFAVYNHLQTEKELKVYRYFGHEYTSPFQMEKLKFLQNHLKGQTASVEN
ncbi:acetylxylan esterase [Fictibacillus fluitans]|uniref:Acetylxylan esterase n=1 Tax=Fictibacillus fluitans TaxID=3058422 RepID=A0ABT8HWN9_9BACL|nr:acetylxylan esterase [Fictibacillus sp. NE201]MDN4525174.1 acetylxylan esterase [Fictibacillus sp. NE201]